MNFLHLLVTVCYLFQCGDREVTKCDSSVLQFCPCCSYQQPVAHRKDPEFICEDGRQGWIERC